MSVKLIGEHWEGDVRVRWWGDDATNEITIERWQDGQAALDHVAEANANGVPTTDGLGKPIAEIPIVVAQQFCEKRGIPWERFLYSNDYDTEFKRFAQDYSRLAYEAKRTVHTVQ